MTEVPTDTRVLIAAAIVAEPATSNRRLAQRFGVSHVFIAKVRRMVKTSEWETKQGLEIARCEVCGLVFEYLRIAQPRKVCSDLCRLELQKRRAAERASRLSCERCGGPLRNPGSRFCSPLCANRTSAERFLSIPQVPCPVCDAPFTPRKQNSKGNHRKATCSRECARFYGRPVASPVPWAECGCGERYVAGRGKACPRCAAYRQIARALNQMRVTALRGEPRECALCGSTFYAATGPASGAYSRRYCSDPCASSMREMLMRTNGRYEQGITTERVAERDGYLCHLCGGGVTPADWSVDHVLPISRGGTHTWDNVACAHLLCNSRRGNRLLEDVPQSEGVPAARTGRWWAGVLSDVSWVCRDCGMRFDRVDDRIDHERLLHGHRGGTTSRP